MNDDQALNQDREVDYDGDEQGQDSERMFRPEKQSHLPEDGAPPAHPADDIKRRSELDYPAKDTDIDPDEAYHEGSDQARRQTYEVY